ncbi:DNA polymerase III subunit psi [Vibrio sp. V01_P9A10T6]|uniref:DNA polymerase III subunit psi n=1 Tax=Vibrio sp. V01_P9A10T6 TaxID=2116368 RepID=UPI000D0423CF|nr:DNA polymerase III subunit psi [Vibrio sp. V01_P9A10T6]PRQ63684.1 DNA polymerase III subunit psi [Vibrio sp. V01_P9A10T6]
MSHHENQYLQEMGIQRWELIHPQRLAGYQPDPVTLPSTCRLLLVSPQYPQQGALLLFSRVLKSMGLEISQACHLEPHSLSQLTGSSIEWLWFSGCEKRESPLAKKVLTSPPLVEIDGNTELRRALWQQICSYES